MQQMPGQTHNRRAITAKTIGVGCGGLFVAFIAFGLFANYVLGFGPKPAAHVAAPSSAPSSTSTPSPSPSPAVHPASKPPARPVVPTAPAAPAATTPAGGGQCQLQTTQDLIVRTVTPGIAPNAQVLGDVDLVNCQSTLAMIQETAPRFPGDCTQVALSKDNPGYNADATPAGPLRKVILAIGPACR